MNIEPVLRGVFFTSIIAITMASFADERFSQYLTRQPYTIPLTDLPHVRDTPNPMDIQFVQYVPTVRNTYYSAEDREKTFIVSGDEWEPMDDERRIMFKDLSSIHFSSQTYDLPTTPSLYNLIPSKLSLEDFDHLTTEALELLILYKVQSNP